MIFLEGKTGCEFILGSFYSNTKGLVKKIYKDKNEIQAHIKELYFSELFENQTKGWKLHSEQTQNLTIAWGSLIIVTLKKFEDYFVYEKFYLDFNNEKKFGFVRIPPNIYYSLVQKNSTKSLILNFTFSSHDPRESKTINLDDIPFFKYYTV
mgnify:CR=1 FL=1